MAANELLGNFIRKFSHYWTSFTGKTGSLSSDSRFTRPPDADEPITVYATQSDHPRANGTARHDPFMPNAKQGNTKSCFRILDLVASDIWVIALKHVINDKIKQIYGRFDLDAGLVYKQLLQFRPDNIPPRHANIVGWPVTSLAQKDKAMKLAAESVFHCQVQHGEITGEACYNKNSRCLIGSTINPHGEVRFSANTIKELPDAMANSLAADRNQE